NVHGLARAAVHSQIRLLIAVEVEGVDGEAAVPRGFPDRGTNRLAVRLHLARCAGVHRNELHRRSRSAMRALTSLRTSAAGNGLSGEKRTVPLLVEYFFKS